MNIGNVFVGIYKYIFQVLANHMQYLIVLIYKNICNMYILGLGLHFRYR